MTLVNVWINCPSREVAHRISQALMAERLVACTNTFSEIQSAFHWKGKVEHQTEVPLLAKTREDLFDALCRRVAELHPYEIPGIIAMQVAKVNRDYEDWVIAETGTTARTPRA